MGVPFILRNKIIGTMVVEHNDEKKIYNEEDFSLFKTIGVQVALALERVNLHEKTNRMAITDDLTGLFNYHYFKAVTRKEFVRSRRYHKPFALMVIDLDHFKVINDTYEHLAGDQVLHTLASVLLQSLRSSDIVGRYVGEDFVIIFLETNIEEVISIPSL